MNKDSPFKSIKPALRKYGPALRGKVAILEGLISAGKSTAGEEIAKFVNDLGIPCRFFPEPLLPGLLDLFLSDQKTYAFSFQLTMLVKRQAIYREAFELAKQGYFCIIDRSLYGDYCFALMHKNRGNISEERCLDKNIPSEWKSYLEVLHSEKFEHPDYVIYLQVNPDTAIRRCMKRDRKGEGAYNKQYFVDLCAVYNDIIPNSPANNFIVLDWNDDKDEKPTSCIINPILDEIKKHYDKF